MHALGYCAWHRKGLGLIGDALLISSLVDELALVPVMGNAGVSMCLRSNGTHALHWQMDCLLCWQAHSQNRHLV